MLGEGLVIAVIGIFVVAAALGLISALLYLLKFAGGSEKPKPVEVAVNVSEPIAVQQDDSEIVAAITAAIAASLNTTADKLVVRSFRKVSAWNTSSCVTNSIINNNVSGGKK